MPWMICPLWFLLDVRPSLVKARYIPLVPFRPVSNSIARGEGGSLPPSANVMILEWEILSSVGFGTYYCRIIRRNVCSPAVLLLLAVLVVAALIPVVLIVLTHPHPFPA